MPIVTIVAFDDDLLIKSKRLYWDQACVLKQVGLIPMISRCPFNGEDTEVPAKGVQQSDPLLSKEQLEDINSLDILNRYSLRQASIERFKSLKSVNIKYIKIYYLYYYFFLLRQYKKYLYILLNII